jgi:2-methylisocitrate lyase-like PEP mutase family enzyme
MEPAMTDHAATFHALHAAPQLLILPNAWDAGSARLIESCGARAIATTSAGVAWSHGYRDGDALPIDLYLASLANVVGAVAVPVTADIEGGYADAPPQVAANAQRVFEAGVVGINIEDGAGTPEAMAEKVAAIRASVGPALFINARIDVYLRGLAPGGAIDAVLARAALYRAAGCDGVFVPGVTASADIAALVAGVAAPLNVMARPALPDAAALSALGVRRLSAGSAIAQALYGLAGQLTRDFLDGESVRLFDTAMAYPDINALMRQV